MIKWPNKNSDSSFLKWGILPFILQPDLPTTATEFLSLSCRRCLQAWCSKQNCLILTHSDVLPVNQKQEHTASDSLPASPQCSAGIHSLWQRAVLIVHTEVQWGHQSGRAKRDMLCHLATVTRFFSFCFCKAFLISDSLDPSSISFPQLDITCRKQVKIQGASHSQSFTHIGFSVLSWEHFWEVFPHTHI